MNPLILYRTVARAQQLEAEERNSVPHTRAQLPGFTDDPEEQQATATATLIRDDQIDFVDSQGIKGAYQDEFSEDEDDVFRFGDGDDSAISLGRQFSQR